MDFIKDWLKENENAFIQKGDRKLFYKKLCFHVVKIKGRATIQIESSMNIESVIDLLDETD
jgi:hypothetical protein